MKTNTLFFSFKETGYLVSLIRELNGQGIPYTLEKDSEGIHITVSTGF